MACYTPFQCGLVLQWWQYHIIASTLTHTLCTNPCHTAPCVACLRAHAECVMSEAWERLRQILYSDGGLVSVWAQCSARAHSSASAGCLNDQQDPHCSSPVICHSILPNSANVFSGKHVALIRGYFLSFGNVNTVLDCEEAIRGWEAVVKRQKIWGLKEGL